MPRRENVVGVRGKTKRHRKKSVDPESGARSHSREMCMNMADAQFLQAQPDINSLIKPKKIGAPTPVIECSDNFRRELSLF